jgi:hypothetical protein
MWKFTKIICSLPTLLVAAALCGAMAYFTNPEFLPRIATISSMSGLGLCAVAGYFAAIYAHIFGSFWLDLGGQRGPWYKSPAGGAYLVVVLALLAIASYHICPFVLAQAIQRGGMTRWGAVFQILTVALLAFAFTVGTSGASENQCTPPDTDVDDGSTPPACSSRKQPKYSSSRHLTHDRD